MVCIATVSTSVSWLCDIVLKFCNMWPLHRVSIISYNCMGINSCLKIKILIRNNQKYHSKCNLMKRVLSTVKKAPPHVVTLEEAVTDMGELGDVCVITAAPLGTAWPSARHYPSLGVPPFHVRDERTHDFKRLQNLPNFFLSTLEAQSRHLCLLMSWRCLHQGLCLLMSQAMLLCEAQEDKGQSLHLLFCLIGPCSLIAA